MPWPDRFSGLIAAAFTPMKEDGSLNLKQVVPIVDHLVADGVQGIYVCGSTGEGPSLAMEERQAVAEAYAQAARGRLLVIVQVGHDSLVEARQLAAHARQIGADAIAAIPPVYFKCRSLRTLLDCLREIAAAAPDLPFFYYHIPSLTGVNFDMVEFLREGAGRLPNLAGIKYSATTVYELQACAEFQNRRFPMLFGCDEMLLSGLAAGAAGAIGSTYNFAAPLYRRIIDAVHRGEMETARQDQALSVTLVRTLMRYGGPPGLKTMMKVIGLDCGPVRLPLVRLSPAEEAALLQDIERIGFFRWGRT